ncbi:MAG: hypothetical protein R6V01_00700 [Thermoplasmatota archaeon]
MDDQAFSICLQECNGIRVWEMEGIPQPNEVDRGTALYYGQGYVENLIKTVNHKAYMEHEELFMGPLFYIFECSLEQGVEDVGLVQWDDQRHYTRISWTGYSWKLPHEIKRRTVSIEISKLGENEVTGRILISLKKIAEAGGDIQIPPKIVSKLDLRNGNEIRIKMKFSS